MRSGPNSSCFDDDFSFREWKRPGTSVEATGRRRFRSPVRVSSEQVRHHSRDAEQVIDERDHKHDHLQPRWHGHQNEFVHQNLTGRRADTGLVPRRRQSGFAAFSRRCDASRQFKLHPPSPRGARTHRQPLRLSILRSTGPSEIALLREQRKLWPSPRVDVLVIATSGRFTTPAIRLIEQQNQSDSALRIEPWASSHLEGLLARRHDLLQALQEPVDIPFGCRSSPARRDRRLAPHRQDGEWFLDCPELRALLARLLRSDDAASSGREIQQ